MSRLAPKPWRLYCRGADRALRVIGVRARGPTKRSLSYLVTKEETSTFAGAASTEKIRHVTCAVQQANEGQEGLGAGDEAGTWIAFQAPGNETQAKSVGGSSRLRTKKRRRRILRVLPTTDASALTRLLTAEVRKSEEVVVQAVGAQGGCVAMCAISQARSASHTLGSFDLALKPLMLVGDPPPNVRHGLGNAGKKARGQRPSSRLSDRFLFFLHRVPLQAGVLAPIGQQQQPVVAQAGSEEHAFTLSATLAKALLPEARWKHLLKVSQETTLPTKPLIAGSQPGDAHGGESSSKGVMAASGNALLRALQGICLARGRLWKKGKELPSDVGLDLLLFVDAPPEPLVADDGKQKGTRRSKHTHTPREAMGGASETVAQQAGVHFLAFICGKWDWDVNVEGNGGGVLDASLREDGYIAPAAEDEFIMPL